MSLRQVHFTLPDVFSEWCNSKAFSSASGTKKKCLATDVNTVHNHCILDVMWQKNFGKNLELNLWREQLIEFAIGRDRCIHFAQDGSNNIAGPAATAKSAKGLPNYRRRKSGPTSKRTKWGTAVSFGSSKRTKWGAKSTGSFWNSAEAEGKQCQRYSAFSSWRILHAKSFKGRKRRANPWNWPKGIIFLLLF